MKMSSVLWMGLLVAGSLGLFLQTQQVSAEELEIVFTNVTPSKGYLMIVLVDGEENWQEVMSGNASVASQSWKQEVGAEKRQSFVFDGFDAKTLQDGSYAIIVYQDVDANGKMKQGLFGIPQEPVGFSNNAPVLFGPPKYKDAKIKLNSGEKIIEIPLR